MCILGCKYPYFFCHFQIICLKNKKRANVWLLIYFFVGFSAINQGTGSYPEPPHG